MRSRAPRRPRRGPGRALSASRVDAAAGAPAAPRGRVVGPARRGGAAGGRGRVPAARGARLASAGARGVWGRRVAAWHASRLETRARRRDACRRGSWPRSSHWMFRGRRPRLLPRRSLLGPLELPPRRPPHLAGDLDLRLERHPEALVDPAPSLRHQREDVRGRRAAGVLDEVRVLLGEPRAADLEPSTPGRLEQLPGGAPRGAGVAGWILEGRPEGLDPRRLRLPPLLAHLGEDRLDPRHLAVGELEGGAGDD